jgi:hydroxymethylpyrimidine pyrophosphatase-like HAD family hydrolase
MMGYYEINKIKNKNMKKLLTLLFLLSCLKYSYNNVIPFDGASIAHEITKIVYSKPIKTELHDDFQEYINTHKRLSYLFRENYYHFNDNTKKLVMEYWLLIAKIQNEYNIIKEKNKILSLKKQDNNEFMTFNFDEDIKNKTRILEKILIEIS